MVDLQLQKPTRHRYRRRARTVVATSFAFFAAMQIGLLLAIEFVWPVPRDPLYGRKLRQLDERLAEAPPDSLLVLLLGSSRVFNGVDANTLERELGAAVGRPVTVYNFGLSAAGPLTEMIVLNRLLSAGIKPDLVLVELFPAMMTDHQPLLEADAIATSRLWHCDLSLLRRCDASFAGVWQAWWRRALTPCHTYRYGLLGAFSTAWLPAAGWGTAYAPIDPKGWQCIDAEACPPESRPGAVLVARVKYRPALDDFRLGTGARAMQETLQLCRRERIRAALVVMPEGKDFQSWYSPHARASLAAFAERLAADQRVPVIDARSWMPDSEFFDSHHLLTGGAVRFSQRLSGPTAGMLDSDGVATVAAPTVLRR